MWPITCRHIQHAKSLAYVLDAAAVAEHTASTDASSLKDTGNRTAGHVTRDPQPRTAETGTHGHAGGVADHLLQQWRHLQAELRLYDPELLATPSMLVINKVDLVPEADRQGLLCFLTERVASLCAARSTSVAAVPVLMASALKGTGVQDVQTALQQLLARVEADAAGQ